MIMMLLLLESALYPQKNNLLFLVIAEAVLVMVGQEEGSDGIGADCGYQTALEISIFRILQGKQAFSERRNLHTLL